MINISNAQAQAADPANSIWVSAAAGTGKTKVLVDRLVRLMINEVPWHKILCLTFTNAAASEMRQRVSDRLQTWTNLPTEKLAADLTLLLNRKPTSRELEITKTLFAKYCLDADQLKITTIHAFSQYILRKFALEAKLSPYFTVIDQLKADSIMKQLKAELIADTNLVPEVQQALTLISANFHDQGVTQLLSNILASHLKFQNLAKIYNHVNKYYDKLRQIFQLNHHTKEDIAKHFNTKLRDIGLAPEIGLDEATLALIQELDNYLTLPPSVQVTKFQQLKSYFLTQAGLPKARLSIKAVERAYPNLYSQLQQIQELVLLMDEQLKSLAKAQLTDAIFTLACHIIKMYQRYKRQHHYLDYDDLIAEARELLINHMLKDWILYKLDGGIEHLLVDEAQDTSSIQWEIIEAIIDDFFAGWGARDVERTIFVVGDDKQSIYSFQGANPKIFHQVSFKLHNKMRYSKKNYQNIDLNCSYRSSSAIITAVQHLFTNLQQDYPHYLSKAKVALTCFRQDHPGTVELWQPLTVRASERDPWTIPSMEKEALSAQTLLAKQIADYIKRTLDSKLILPSSNRVVRPSDFMILLRTRTPFAVELVKALQAKQILVPGIDKINLTNELAILDLLAVAKFVLFPFDDLNLAGLLKSVFINLDETSIYEISTQRGELGIWQYLQQTKDDATLTKLEMFLNIYKQHTLLNFFHIIVDGLGFRELLCATSPESNDAIDEFLAIVVNFYHNINTNLQAFIHWIADYQVDKHENTLKIKRDLEYSEGVKIMTIHAAKGLQSGIVILADTTSLPYNQDDFLWTEEGIMLWNGGEANNISKFYYEQQKDRNYQEYLRLLYVALTRAADKLIICGYHSGETIKEDCWYSLIEKYFQKLANICMEDKLIYHQGEFLHATADDAEEIRSLPLNPLKTTVTRPEPAFVQPVAPVVGNYNNSPLVENIGIIYGRVVHKIIEDFINYRDITLALQHPILKNLPNEEKAIIQRAISKLVHSDDFQQLINNEYFSYKTEVSIYARESAAIQVGRIDLLLMNNQEVIIIDYKTDAAPPTTRDEVSEAYLAQLKFYHQVLATMYSERHISSKILWVKNCQLMDIYST